MTFFPPPDAEPTRIIEHLDDGRIRYRSTSHGIQTGQQIGLYALRDALLPLPSNTARCRLCGRSDSIPKGDRFVVDALYETRAAGAGSFVSREDAAVFADSLAFADHPRFPAWACYNVHAEVDSPGHRWQPFRQWLRDVADA